MRTAARILVSVMLTATVMAIAFLHAPVSPMGPDYIAPPPYIPIS